MQEDVLLERGAILVRRLRLDPSDYLPWHVDPYHRVTVVMAGDRLEIEYRDGGEPRTITCAPGQVDWDEPTDRPHRAKNIGAAYEEVTIFFRDREGAPHQPRV